MQIAEQLGYKYGKKFAHEASTNCNGTVNSRVSWLMIDYINIINKQLKAGLNIFHYLITVS